MAQQFFITIGTGVRGSRQQFVAGFGIQTIKSELFALAKNQDLETQLVDAASGTGLLGTLVYDELVISGGTFFEQEDLTQSEPISYEGLKIQNLLIEINFAKNVIVTKLQGRNGSVKEYISDEDYAITLTGLLIGENQGDLENSAQDAEVVSIGNFYPELDVARLKAILEVPAPITLTSDFLNIFDISECVVINASIPQREASVDTQPFQINLLSDREILLTEVPQ